MNAAHQTQVRQIARRHVERMELEQQLQVFAMPALERNFAVEHTPSVLLDSAADEIRQRVDDVVSQDRPGIACQERRKILSVQFRRGLRTFSTQQSKDGNRLVSSQ